MGEKRDTDMKYKVTAQSVGAEISSIIEAENEDQAWHIMKKMYGNHIFNGKIENVDVANQAVRIAALEEEKAKLIDLLQKYQDGYYTDGVIGLTAGFDEAVSRVLAEVTNA